MEKLKNLKYKIKYKIPNKFGIYERAVKQFGVDFDKGIVFTIGNKIYANQDLPDHLIIHEKTHIQQQAKMGVEKWWNQYFECKEFRFIEETKAYQNQYKFARNKYGDTKQVAKMLKHSAECLSGSMYGNLCDYKTAKDLIQKK